MARTASVPRTVLTALLGVVTVALLSAGCGSGDTPAQAAPAELNQADLAVLPDLNTFGKIDNAPLDPAPTAPSTGKVLKVTKELPTYDKPGGKPFGKLPTLQVGSPTWVPVIAEQGEWAQVLLPSRPNGLAGWIHTPGATESAPNPYTVKINLADYSLDILRDGKSQGTHKVGIGKPEFPTPKGRHYLMASIEETKNTYSKYVLPLSAHSDSHETFGGGPGTVALHTWPTNEHIGKSDSDGCIRVTPETLTKLMELPLGTVVYVA
ncbi:L,D-transpeptidase [Allokutzneria oryzae]|uniref:L,D-transpeptidase n=1 Tax=Allokutzneria oryzae TaxID=1378989 RepID=A0ABV6ABT9_9PSEU